MQTLSFGLSGYMDGQDRLRSKQIQDEEIAHTKERRAALEPLQDRALKTQVEGAERDAQYQQEDRPLERKGKEQDSKIREAQLTSHGLQNSIHRINLEMLKTSQGERNAESSKKMIEMQGARMYAIGKLAEASPEEAAQALNGLPESKKYGLQAAWVGYIPNPNDPKDTEKYLVARDAKGNIINSPVTKKPTMFKKSALDSYGPVSDKYVFGEADGRPYSGNKQTGVITTPGGAGGMPTTTRQDNKDAWSMSSATWGSALGDNFSFSGENAEYASMNATLNVELRKKDPSLGLAEAHEKAYAMTKAAKTRNEFTGKLDGAPGAMSGADPNKAAQSVIKYFPYGAKDEPEVRKFMSQHGIPEKADQDDILKLLKGEASNAAAATPSKPGNTSLVGKTAYVKGKGEIPRVETEEDFKAVKSGEYFVTSSGQVKQKP